MKIFIPQDKKYRPVRRMNPSRETVYFIPQDGNYTFTKRIIKTYRNHNNKNKTTIMKQEEEKLTGVPENAFRELKPGEVYNPLMSPDRKYPEVNLWSVLWGIAMAVLFSAAAAYLGLKVGQVFEAAIPIAIIAVGVSGAAKRKNALGENVIIQSIGASSGVIVAGAIFTLPALYILQESYPQEITVTFAQVFISSLLGGVLGWAFTQPLLVLMVVFWAVGLGMALPYILFSIWPQLARILPRPGNWMKIFERVLGFCLLGTALYLLSILPVEKHMQVLCVLLVLSLVAWLWGQFCGPASPRLRCRIIGALTVLILVGSFIWVLRPAAPLVQWREFSPEQFQADLGQKAMLLEFTADSCPNCKVLEATVLTDERMRKLRARYGMELIRVDLTGVNAYGIRLLEALGSKSIPLTVLFPAGEQASSPLVLRDVYTAGTLEDALEKAFGQ